MTIMVATQIPSGTFARLMDVSGVLVGDGVLRDFGVEVQQVEATCFILVHQLILLMSSYRFF